ncbi:hypothetical protein EMIT0P176_180043 [Pseudomonas sp. IT-P176]
MLRCTSSRCVRLRRTALRASPQMDTFAQPADGRVDQDQKQEHGDLTVGLSGKSGRGDLTVGLAFPGVRVSPVGASLLAMGAAQPTFMVPDTPPSRASPVHRGAGRTQNLRAARFTV